MMRFMLCTTASLLSLLLGVTVWTLQPTQKTFSWVSTSHLEFLAGFLPNLGTVPPSGQAPHTFKQYRAALRSLRQNVKGDYYPFVSFGGMGNRLRLEGRSYPLFHEYYVSSGFFEARRVGALYGRLIDQEEEGVAVLGYTLAQQLFNDVSEAVGRVVTLGSPDAGSAPQRLKIVGVLTPSPAQDPAIDVDEGLVLSLNAGLDKSFVHRITPLYLQISFHQSSDIEAVLPSLEAWTQRYFGAQGEVRAIDDLFDMRQRLVDATLPKIGARRTTLLAFGVGLGVAALLALYAQSYWYLLRRRQLLGVEKALGATRKQLMMRLIGAQAPWGLLGGLLGWAGLWLLRDLLPSVFLTRPPVMVLAVAMLTPVLALLLLAAVVSLPTLTQPPMALLRGRASSGRIRLLLGLVYSGLALALAGGLATSQVFTQVQRESGALTAQFGAMYALQAGDAVVDDRTTRAFEATSDFSPIFTPEDARALESVDGVTQATVTQVLPSLEVAFRGTSLHLLATAADNRYLDFMGLSLRQGNAEGCVLNEEVSRKLGATVGASVTLTGLTGPISCRVTGIMQRPPELWSWLVADLPELVAPPTNGLGLPLPGYDAKPFRSNRILVKLSNSDLEGVVKDWQQARYSELRAEVVPYTPDVGQLLTSLRAQAQLFLLVALLAAALSVWSIVGGFLTLLETERFRIALDRALGLSLKHLTRTWWLQTLGLGTISVVFGLFVGHVLTVRLYNALALDIPRLPDREVLGFSPSLLLVVLTVLLALSAGLTLLAAHWIRKQSSLTMLKEGAS